MNNKLNFEDYEKMLELFKKYGEIKNGVIYVNGEKYKIINRESFRIEDEEYIKLDEF